MIQQHGGNIEQLRNILDFSANINPLGTPDSVKKAIVSALECIEKYPDPNCTKLRDRIAEHERISAKNIVCGNGADDMFFRIVHALRPRKALICAPAFSEYSRALAEVSCDVLEHTITEDKSFDLDKDILSKLDSNVDMCFICTPNNPTGRLIAPDLLGRIAEKCRQNDIFLVCDECFMGFVKDSSKYSMRQFLSDNCIILKAFTKLYAMPGIRLGYAVCGSISLADKIHKSGQFWSVSSLAQAAGIVALAEGNYVRDTVSFIENERNYLAAELSDAGVKVYDGAANFLLFRTRAGLAEELLGHGILIRDCQNYSGLTEGFYRIAVRTHEENIRLITALRRCLNG